MHSAFMFIRSTFSQRLADAGVIANAPRYWMRLSKANLMTARIFYATMLALRQRTPLSEATTKLTQIYYEARHANATLTNHPMVPPQGRPSRKPPSYFVVLLRSGQKIFLFQHFFCNAKRFTSCRKSAVHRGLQKDFL